VKPFFFPSQHAASIRKKKSQNTNLVERPDALLPGVRLEVLEDHLRDDEARRGQVWGLLQGSSSSGRRGSFVGFHGCYCFFLLSLDKGRK
jgi:hypothetical protein